MKGAAQLKHGRRNNRISRFGKLTRQQKHVLDVMMFKEKLTYRAIASRLWAQFAIKASSATISKYFRDHTGLSIPPQPKQQALIDVLIESKKPIRVTVLKNNGARILCQVNRLFHRFSKKQAVIAGDAESKGGNP